MSDERDDSRPRCTRCGYGAWIRDDDGFCEACHYEACSLEERAAIDAEHERKMRLITAKSLRLAAAKLRLFASHAPYHMSQRIERDAEQHVRDAERLERDEETARAPIAADRERG